MLSKSRRLTSQMVEGVFKNKKSVFGDSVSVFFKKDPTIKESRFAISVSGKAVRTAVKRNQIRRQLYLVVGTLFERLQPSFYCVFVVKKDITLLKKLVVGEEIKNLMQKVVVLR